jgi:hypothetical protein
MQPTPTQLPSGMVIHFASGALARSLVAHGALKLTTVGALSMCMRRSLALNGSWTDGMY